MPREPHSASVVASKVSDQRESEWQLDVPDRGAVERWIEGEGKLGGISAGEGKTLRLTDRYYDTEDWRLWRAGYALRVRSRGKSSEATLKSLAGAGEEGIKHRREISEPLSSGAEPPTYSEGPVGVRVRALAGDRKLGELFEVHTRRLAYPLYGEAEGEPEVLGELALDETEIPVPGSEDPLRLERVEVEAQDMERLAPFVSELRESCGLSPASDSKFGAGLRARGLTPPGEPDLGPERIDPTLTLGVAAYAVMRRQFVRFLRHEPGVRLGEDPEEVHDMCVASRRLRAALQAFEPALSEKARRFEPELKHFAAVLGEVRDLDVQLERVEAWISASPEEEHGPLEELRGALRSEREAARERMLSELDSRRYERLVDTLSRTLRLGHSRRNSLSGSPVTEAAPDLLRDAHRRTREAGDHLGPDSPAEEYHSLRRRCKRLRYLTESLEEVYGKPSRKLVKRLKSLQSVLGGLQQTEIARAQLRRLATEPGGHDLSHAAAFAMGGMAARHASGAAGLRESFPKAYSGIKGKPWKRLEKAMRKMRKASPEPGE